MEGDIDFTGKTPNLLLINLNSQHSNRKLVEGIMKKKIAVLSLACIFATSVVSGKELSQREKSAYSDDKTFEEICFSPKDASSKSISKHKCQISYQEQTLNIPRSFPRLIGEYVIVKPALTGSSKIILLYKKSNDYLFSKFKEISPDSTVTIYGTLRHKTVKKVDYYFMIIDDVEKVVPKSVISDEPDSPPIAFVEADYEQVSFREFQVNFTKYLDKKVYLSLHLKNIVNQLNTQLQKIAGMSVENYFVINAVHISEFDLMEPKGLDVQQLGINIVANREDENITRAIIETPDNKDMLFYGRLKKLEDPTSSRVKPTYFFMLDGIKASKQSAVKEKEVESEDTVESEEEIQPPVESPEDDFSDNSLDSSVDSAP